MDKLVEALKDNEELRKQMTEMWASEASAQEMADALAAAGIEADADMVETALQKMQAERSKSIGFEDVDAEQLEKLAGGSNEGCRGADGYYIEHESCMYYEGE